MAGLRRAPLVPRRLFPLRLFVQFAVFMKKSLAVLAALTLTAGSAFADAGIFGGYAGIVINGSPIQWFNLVDLGNDGAGAFQGANFGTFNPLAGNTLSLGGAEGLVFKNNGSDVTGVTFNYRIYPTGPASGSFTAVGRDFTADAPFADAAGNQFANAGDQKWANNQGSGTQPPVNLLSGLANGTYRMEIFFSGTTNGVNANSNLFLNNNGPNYLATFTVIPEPSTYATMLAGAMGAGLVAFRRRRG